MKGALSFLAVVVAVVAFGLVLFAGWRAMVGPQSLVDEALVRFDSPVNARDTSQKSFVVRQGDSAGQIAERLENEGLISDSFFFRVRVELEGVGSYLAAGDYELSPSMRPSEILSILVQGKTKASPLVAIPEGWRAEEVAERFAARGVGTPDQFMRLVREGSVSSTLLESRPSGTSLEGYLFPESYAVDGSSTPESVVQRMVGQFEKQFTQEMREKAAKRGMTVHQIVVLASVIEREAVIPSERPLMAGVFYNRLEAGMRIQSDPTVQYALATVQREAQARYGWWKNGLTVDDLAVDSPYNTYRYPGLPPGPICNPGLASLKAAVEPTTTGYYYFVAKPDGTHAFARTLDEHNQNVATYGR